MAPESFQNIKSAALLTQHNYVLGTFFDRQTKVCRGNVGVSRHTSRQRVMDNSSHALNATEEYCIPNE